MLTIFGKGKVGTGLKNLLDFLKQINPKIDYILMDDSDYNENKLKESTDIIVSPGIPPHHKLYKDFSNKIISELTFTGKIIQQANIRQNLIIVGISGTNGKSTTTHITHELFQKLKRTNPLGNKIKVHLSGNFGTPFSETLINILQDQSSYYLVIMEVSSFMLYKLKDFTFNYSILTNIETDHLDRHPDINNYKETKLNLIKYTTKLALTTEKVYKTLDKNLQAKTIKYGYNYDLNGTQFIGHHNKANLQAVYLLTQNISDYFQLNINGNTIKNQLKEIKPLEHRLQLVKEINEIKIYDDGICTSSHAQENAIKGFEEKVILICGGYDKGDSFKHLSELYKDKIIYGIFIGQTATQFTEIFQKENIEHTTKKTLKDAIHESLNYAKKENIKTILFSPGCASFGMFKNVYDRIEQFTKLIKDLK